jgi:hypothetical protein
VTPAPIVLAAAGSWICAACGLLPLALLAICVVLSWNVDLFLRRKDRQLLRRFNHGCCLNCGYDLRGSPTGVCPECGKSSIEM